jgi:glycerophosphoryl diester phosphodiesterase
VRFPEIIAHRGASLDAPENTVAAFELAIEQGADRVELDVQLVRDGLVVVCHDPTLERTTDVGSHFPDRTPWDLRTFDSCELERLTAAWPEGVDGEPCRIPSLDQVLDALDGRVRLLLELKKPSRHPGLVEAVVERLTAHPSWLEESAEAVLTVQSFDSGALTAIQTQLPGHVRYCFVSGYETRPDVAELPDWVGAVAVDECVVDASLVREVRSSGRSLNAWTVNDADRMRELLDVDVDGIITDAPGVLAGIRAERASTGAGRGSARA